MARPEVDAVLLDLGLPTIDAETRTDGPVVDGARGLLRQLEPLVVELNLAGYEVVSAVASPGPSASTIGTFVRLDTALVDPSRRGRISSAKAPKPELQVKGVVTT